MQKFILLFCLFMFQCYTAKNMIKMDQIQTIEKGNSIETVKSMFTEPPESEFTVSEQSKTYQILLYLMQTGTKKGATSVPSPQGGFTSITHNEPVAEDYVFIFEDDNLLYWGFLHELGRSENDLIVSLGNKINEKLKQNKS